MREFPIGSILDAGRRHSRREARQYRIGQPHRKSDAVKGTGSKTIGRSKCIPHMPL
jgi:hypothetical protein